MSSVKRKRSGTSEEGVGSHQQRTRKESSPNRPPPAPLLTKTNNQGGPAPPKVFENGSDLVRCLETNSADALRSALSQLRNQISVQHHETSRDHLIPASDRRIRIVTEYCQLCHSSQPGASSSSPTSSEAAKGIFAAWELAEKQSLPTLLPLPIFVLAQILPLLSAHYPNHALGESIIQRLLSPSEPWFNLLQTYVANAGGSAKDQSVGKGRDGAKASDVTTMASLKLLKEMVSFAQGKFSNRVFESFNWGIKSLPRMLNMRRRRAAVGGKGRSKQVGLVEVNLQRPDIRTLYILFLLSFLSQTYSTSLKISMLELGREFLPNTLKGLVQDPADVVEHVLVVLHEDLVRDEKVPRSKKVGFWNEWACECIVKLYSREGERVALVSGSGGDSSPTVADLAHHFLLSIASNPGFGICYADRGWYPRLQASSSAEEEETLSVERSGRVTVGGEHQVEQIEREAEKEKRDGNQSVTSSIGGGAIYNKVLSGLLKQLAVTDDLRQQELALKILKACPELVGPYLESSCGGLTLEPRASSKWLCNVAFVSRVLALEIPSFRNFKLERASEKSPSSSSSYPEAYLNSFATNPPPLSTILSNTLPSPLSRSLLTKGINYPDRLVRHTASTLLARCLERLSRYRSMSEAASLELDEGDQGAWKSRLRNLEIESRKRVPEISNVIQMMQNLTNNLSQDSSSSLTNPPPGQTDSEVSVERTEPSPAVNLQPKTNYLLAEVSLRLLWLYHLSIPSSAFDSRFDVGKLLTNSFMSPMSRKGGKRSELSESGAEQRKSEVEEEEEDMTLDLASICQVHALRIVSLSAESSFDWSSRAPGGGASGRSYLCLLLTVYLTSPLRQVRSSCDQLFDRLISTSNLFEHDPKELSAWLVSLPASDDLARGGNDGKGPVQGAPRSSQGGGGALAKAESDSDPMGSLSEEQANVLLFFDDCLQRCVKTPYRYIESARAFVKSQGEEVDGQEMQVEGREEEEEGGGPGQDQNRITTNISLVTDLVASPLLMTMLEQFTIRASKGLFDQGSADERRQGSTANTTPTVDSLLSFFSRLLPLLVGCGRPLVAIQKMAERMRDSVLSAEKVRESTRLMADVLVARVISIGRAPRPELLPNGSVANGSGMAASQAVAFKGFTDVAGLRRTLRSACRPLSAGDVRDLVIEIARLVSEGSEAAKQLLQELDPERENVFTSTRGIDDLQRSHLPILHLDSSSRTIPGWEEDSSQAGEDDDDCIDGHANLSIVQAQLSTSVAIERLKGSKDDPEERRDQVVQSFEILRKVCRNHLLGTQELARLVFDNQVLLSQLGQEDSALALADLVVEILDPRDASHRPLAAPICRHFALGLTESGRVDDDADLPTLSAIERLLPYFEHELLGKLTNVLVESVVASSQSYTSREGQDQASDRALQLKLCILASSASKGQAGLISSKAQEIVLLSKNLPPGSRASSLLLSLLDQTLESNLPKGLDQISSLSSDGRHGQDYLQGCLTDEVGTHTGKSGFFEGRHHLDRLEIWPILNLKDLIGTDSVLMRIIYSSKSCALQFSEYLRSQVVSESLNVILTLLPNSLRACLDLLVQSPSLRLKAKLEEQVLKSLALSLVAEYGKKSGSGDEVASYALAACASQVHRLLLCHAEGEGSGLSILSSSVVTKQMILFVQASQPGEIFKQSFLQLVLSILPPRPRRRYSTSSIKTYPTSYLVDVFKLTETVLEKGLLWLVRRFAEDAEDSSQLLDCTKSFTAILDWSSTGLKDSEGRRFKSLPKAHLSEPLIEAAIKNRLLSYVPMRLVLSLCRHSLIKMASLSKYVATILAHTEFSSVANGTALLDQVGEDEGDDDEMKTKQRSIVVKVIHSIALRDASKIVNPANLAKLLGVYKGSLSEADRLLLDTFRLFEEQGHFSFLSMARHWSAPAPGTSALSVSMEQNKIYDALLSLEPGLAFATCTSFPRCRRLRRSAASGLVKSQTMEMSRSGGEAGCNLYDPVLVLSLLSGTMTEQNLTGLQWLAILRTNALGLAVCGLSSRCEDMREACLEVLGRAYREIKRTDFQEKAQLLLVLDLLRDCVPPSVGSSLPPPCLPFTITLFVAHCLRSLAAPSSFTYPIFQRFLLQRPSLDAGDVPLLYNLLFSSTDQHRQERVWMLRYLRDCVRCGGRAEWKVFKRRHVSDLLESIYASTSPLSSSSSSGGGHLRLHDQDRSTRSMIEEIFKSMVEIGAVATELITRRSLLPWVIQQQSREVKVSSSATNPGNADPPSVVARVAAEGTGQRDEPSESETDAAWLEIVNRALSNADLERLDRSTGMGWVSMVLRIVSDSIRSNRNGWRWGASPDLARRGRRSKLLGPATEILEKLLRHVVQSTNGRTEEGGLEDLGVLPSHVLSIIQSLTIGAEHEIAGGVGIEVGRRSVRRLYRSVLYLWHLVGEDVEDEVAERQSLIRRGRRSQEGIKLKVTECFQKLVEIEIGLGGEEARRWSLLCLAEDENEGREER
ncbi:hypothetical protein IE53DRAFT_388932 [Violaceomyces palustris]|uniref:Uncharacterized protein n=1 Tax=Violaceomyces palustris TaxID=1673888 RepID=A0ACD0NST0_9BASI|nr:hypothetical protein IE53DRAFT_388932 [Violaceomyces palustris]